MATSTVLPPNGPHNTAPTLLDKTLSVIMRSHDETRLPLFDESLFSLAIQNWPDIEVVIVLQNGTDSFVYEINKLINKLSFSERIKFQIHSVKIPEGVDGRSTLLNVGIEKASGRYLAFLDDDDIVYHHAYSTLIEVLRSGNDAVAVGGSRIAKLTPECRNFHIKSKETPFAWGRTRYDLFKDNFIPIHSYVIDRRRVINSDLYFDDEFPPLEDYDFLLRLGSKYTFDFSRIDTVVCEYRMHGANSIPFGQDLSGNKKYARARQLIDKRKKLLSANVPLTDLLELLSTSNPRAIVNVNGGAKLNGNGCANGHRDPKIVRHLVDKGYEFFSGHPRLEKFLSNSVHFGWRVFTGTDPRNLNGKH